MLSCILNAFMLQVYNIYVYIYIHVYTVSHRGPINGDKVELYDVKGPVLKGRRIFPPLMAGSRDPSIQAV